MFEVLGERAGSRADNHPRPGTYSRKWEQTRNTERDTYGKLLETLLFGVIEKIKTWKREAQWVAGLRVTPSGTGEVTFSASGADRTPKCSA